MADKSAIEWTDATWNPIRARNKKNAKLGWFCTHVSEGCRNCYAEKWNERLGTGLAYKPGHLDDIEIYLDEKMLKAPLRWKTPRRIFTLSMSDLFADFVTDEWLDRIFAVMALADQHSFQVLTKRSARMRTYCKTLGRHASIDRVSCAAKTLSADKGFWYTLGDAGWHLENVWLGVSVENQDAAAERIPDLITTPAAKRFLSCEPMLGAIDLTVDGLSCADCPYCSEGQRIEPDTGANACSNCEDSGKTDEVLIDWVIAGGESGADARPMHPEWIRALRDQCAAARVPFFFKQWGAWVEGAHEPDWIGVANDGGLRVNDPRLNVVRMSRVGKKRAGRLLDGVEHNGFPA